MTDLQGNQEGDESAALSITIAATFTAEPVEASIGHWTRELRMAARVGFAPYNQVFQQLLDPTSLLATNHNGVNVLLVRLEDWQRDLPSDHGNADMERNARDFIAALIAAAERSASTYLVCMCPHSPSMTATHQQKLLFTAMEDRIVSELSEVNGVEVVTTSDLAAAYPVVDYYDSHADTLACIPYTPVFFTALGTMIARKLYAIQCVPHKVIALDCDGTLWNGVCGEDGPEGIQIDDARKALQEFMVRQHDQGMLLCLCSKNNEEDVLDVFARRSDMILTRDHMTAWRVNWSAKSENLQSLSRELGVGLDSFIFIDDDPVECAAVQERCPEILTLQLPNEPDRIPGFVQHVWPFDRRKITSEDRQRTALYKQQILREHFRQQSSTLNDFLANLNLEIDIFPVSPDTIRRVSELTLRTNQFNLTTVRRTEAEIRQLCQPGGAECLAVNVKDRFGDYGLVGVVIFEVRAHSLVVDAFLLSCRALGRGVEHRMLARLGEIAGQRGLSHVVLRCVPSNKNRPAVDFFNGLSEGIQEYLDNGFLVTMTSEIAALVSYKPKADDSAYGPTAPESVSPVSASNRSYDTYKRMALLSSIPKTLYDPELIHARLSRNYARADTDRAFVSPRTPIERKLAEIWRELLGLEQVGIHDHFFDSGGHSLLGTQLISRVREAFQVELPLTILFTDAPTVAGLAAAIELSRIAQADVSEVATTLEELEKLSDEQIKALLASEG